RLLQRCQLAAVAFALHFQCLDLVGTVADEENVFETPDLLVGQRDEIGELLDASFSLGPLGNAEGWLEDRDRVALPYAHADIGELSVLRLDETTQFGLDAGSRAGLCHYAAGHFHSHRNLGAAGDLPLEGED